MRGSVFILVFRRECVPNTAVYFKAISPMTQPHRFLVSLHMYDTTYSFQTSPCPLCSLLWISGLCHSTEIDSLSVIGYFFASSTSANKHQARHTNIPDRWTISVFFGSFLCRVSLLVSPDSYDSAPSILFSGSVASAMIPTGQAEKTLLWRESLISYD